MNSRAKRVRVRGPLGPYSDGFRTELAARGYAPSSAAGQLQVMAHLSRWLVGRGLDGHELASSVVEEFLRARRVAGYGQWLSARGATWADAALTRAVSGFVRWRSRSRGRARG